MHQKTKITILYLLFFVSFSHLSSFAEEVVIMTSEWRPIVSSQMESQGITAEIVREALKATGITCTFEFAPWPRCKALVEYGKVVAAFPYTFNEERDRFAIFSDPFLKSRTVFFYNVKKMSHFDFKDYDTLKIYLIGGVRGYYYRPTFVKHGLKVDFSTNEEDLFKKLFLKRVDIAPMNEIVGWEIIDRLYPGQNNIFAASQTALDESGLALMISKTHHQSDMVFKDFNKGLKIIQTNGIYQKIIEKYGLPIELGYPQSP